MDSRWQWFALRLGRKLWFRAGLFSLLGIATALIAPLVSPLLPPGLSTSIGAKSVDNILQILASSMLAVTAFSLTTMVTAYSSATSNVTPRATTLLIQDPTSQNALSTFIGSFLFSLVGIVALSAGVFDDEGRVILLLATVGVIGVIVVALLRWIEYLRRLGRVGETIDRVEQAAARALAARASLPCLGGGLLNDPDRDIPESAKSLYAESIGYVQHIDMVTLSSCADKHEGKVFVLALPGTFVNTIRPLARVSGIDEEEVQSSIRNAFTIGGERSFDQDPRFGLCVLAEIASRALSPAMNDPGTAIDVIGTAVRLLATWSERNKPGEDPAYPNVLVPLLTVEELFDDTFMPIERDGASMLEIHIRLQKAFLALSLMDGHAFRENARRHSRLALTRAEASLAMDYEKKAVRTLAGEVEGRP